VRQVGVLQASPVATQRAEAASEALLRAKGFEAAGTEDSYPSGGCLRRNQKNSIYLNSRWLLPTYGGDEKQYKT